MRYLGTWYLGIVLALSYSGLAIGHGGGLDANGCHNNRKTGDYHCHRAPQQPQNIPQPQPLADVGQSIKPVQYDNTCYTGPRGGRYRMVNGNKRYGC